MRKFSLILLTAGVLPALAGSSQTLQPLLRIGIEQHRAIRIDDHR